MHTWIMRIVGVANIAFCAAGLAYFAWSISLNWRQWPGSPSSKEWAEFYGIAAVNLFLIGYSALLGIRLIKKDISAILPTYALFIMDIIFLIFFVGLSWYLVPATNHRMVLIVVQFWGIAESSLVPQLGLGYPFVGLVGLIGLWIVNKKSARLEKALDLPN
jgi:succinate dehydrogenase hydrophobic anchor subunit